MDRERSTPLHRTRNSALHDSEKRLQQVLDNTGADRLREGQPAAATCSSIASSSAHGPAAGEILGRTDDEVFPPEMATRFRHNDLRVLQEKRSIEFEEAGDFGDGMRTFLSVEVPAVRFGGLAYAVCGMSADITDRKRLEEAFSAARRSRCRSRRRRRCTASWRATSSTILGVDGAFIATVAPTQPWDLRMLAFHLDGEIRENFNYPIPARPARPSSGTATACTPRACRSCSRSTGLRQARRGELRGAPAERRRRQRRSA